MNIPTDAMAEPVPEEFPIACIDEMLPGGMIHLFAGGGARLERGNPDRLGLHDEAVHLHLFGRRLAERNRATEIVAEPFVRGSEIEQNRDRRFEAALPRFQSLTHEERVIRAGIVERCREGRPQRTVTLHLVIDLRDHIEFGHAELELRENVRKSGLRDAPRLAHELDFLRRLDRAQFAQDLSCGYEDRVRQQGLEVDERFGERLVAHRNTRLLRQAEATEDVLDQSRRFVEIAEHAHLDAFGARPSAILRRHPWQRQDRSMLCREPSSLEPSPGMKGHAVIRDVPANAGQIIEVRAKWDIREIGSALEKALESLKAGLLRHFCAPRGQT